MMACIEFRRLRIIFPFLFAITLCADANYAHAQSTFDARMGKFAAVVQGQMANRTCETQIGENGFELYWNFLQIRAALQHADNKKFFEIAQKDPRFAKMAPPDCTKDHTKAVNEARAVAKGLVKEVGARPYYADAFAHYLQKEFPRLIWGYGLERVCRQLSRATRLDFFAFYHMVAGAIDQRGIEDMPFPEDIINEAANSVTPADCNAETKARIGESEKEVRDLARHLGIWSNRTGTVRK